MFKTPKLMPFLAGTAALAAIVGWSPSVLSDDTTLAELGERTHFHGVAVAGDDPSLIYLATHHGLYGVAPDGSARLISDHEDDLMGFTAHPDDPRVLFASGHPAQGGNLGFIVSKDHGRSWQKRSDGLNGPVDFHQMDVSKADPDVIYGAYRGLQRSTDAGHSWEMIGPLPDGLIALAGSSTDADAVYAATQGGLLRSADAGRTWHRIHPAPQPATKVHVTRDGNVYAFMAGIGLLRASEPELDWQSVSGFDGWFILHLASDPTDPDTLYAVTMDARTRAQALRESRDGGRSWSRFGDGQAEAPDGPAGSTLAGGR
jgi:hypothetical protein